MTDDTAAEATENDQTTAVDAARVENEKNAVDVELAANLAARYMQSSRRMRQAVACLLAARRLYAFGMHEIAYVCRNGIIENPNEPVDQLSDKQQLLVQEIYAQSIAVTAAEPFSEVELLASLQANVLPWMQAVTADHQAEQTRRVAEAKDKAEAERISSRVWLGDKHLSDLSRSRTIVLLGTDKALRYVLSRIAEYTQGADTAELTNVNQMVWFSSSRLGYEREQSAWYAEISPTDWHGALNEHRAWNKLLVLSVEPRLSAKVDVLVIDGLLDLMKPMLSVSDDNVVANVNEVHKRLRNWSEFSGCVHVVAQRTDKELTQVEVSDKFKQMSGSADVYAITTVELDNNNVDVFLGGNLLAADVNLN